MTLTVVTGTPVSRVGRLMCTDSTLTTITATGIFQDQAHNFQDISSLSCWVGLVMLAQHGHTQCVRNMHLLGDLGHAPAMKIFFNYAL